MAFVLTALPARHAASRHAAAGALQLRASPHGRPAPGSSLGSAHAAASRAIFCTSASPGAWGRSLGLNRPFSGSQLQGRLINELRLSFAGGGEMSLTFSKTSPVAFAMKHDSGAGAGGGGGGGAGASGGHGGRGGGGGGDGDKEEGPKDPKPAVPDDSMTRYPELSVRGTLRALDYFGTVIFSLTGTVLAGKFGMDLLGCMAVGTITAVGGGTIRDMLLGRRVFWMDGETEYIWMALLTAAATFFMWPQLHKQGIIDEDDDVLFWGDALGIGAFCVIGAQNGIRAGLPPILSIMCSMITSTFGGMTRDVLCRRPPRILHSIDEIYATTAIAGGAAYVGLRAVGVPLSYRIVAAATTAVLLRWFAREHSIKLPTFDDHPGPQPVTHVPRDPPAGRP